MAVELPNAQIVATDVSAAVLEVAPKNAARHGVADRIEFRCGDLFDPIASGERFDLIVSNPPYCREDELEELEPEVKSWEPAGALVAGPDGMATSARLIAEAPAYLVEDGWLLLEVGTQAEQVRRAFVEGGWRDVRTTADLARRPRVVGGMRPET
ncbi:MAG: HemK family protein methyltransferase [Candidatus Dadabacteria bacterium]|nr:MAG: HemK family protein methyltransferase [Candidatus Dadabacteria bacterium]